MKQHWIVVLAALVISGVIGVPGLAVSGDTFEAKLTGTKEVPVCSTTGSGTAKVTISDDESQIDFEVTYDLDGSVRVAHIHLGRPTQAAGVIVFFCGGGGKPACPPSPATVTGTIVAADVVGPADQGIAPGQFDELLGALRSGLTYANVHSDICPGGEVRGQLR
jgi:CHRD domain